MHYFYFAYLIGIDVHVLLLQTNYCRYKSIILLRWHVFLHNHWNGFRL